MLANEDFSRGVEFLQGDEFETRDLLEYVTGENVIVGSMAAVALAESGELEAASRQLLVTLSRMHERVRLILFHLLGREADHAGRCVVEIVVHGDPEWDVAEDLAPLRDLARNAPDDGTTAAYSDLLRDLPDGQLEMAQARLQLIREPALAPVYREILERRSKLIDVDFLASIGRVRSGATPDPATVVASPALVDAAGEIQNLLDDDPARSVLLVGESGVGKSALVKLVATRLRTQGWTILEAGTQQLMAGQMYIGQLEQRVTELVNRLRGRRILWIVSDLHGLASAGTHQYSTLSVLDMILPLIERGELALLAEIQPRAWARLQTTNPRCVTAFAARRIRPLGEEGTLALAREWSERFGLIDGTPALAAGTLNEAWQLAQQYLGDRASPGNLMHLIERTRDRLTAGGTDMRSLIMGSDLLATLSQLTGLPTNILDARAGLDVEALRDLFHRRVMGQPEAVDCLVERVAMIKAGLTDATRPYGVFLFAGPTGTGKTEIAKTLAEFLFGSPERMIRLDMSEYQTPNALEMLLGGERGERPEIAGDASLVSRIRAQPFSVVLLDEFEKADAHIWDIFLQVFDDGRLTDRRGVTADFRHAIIILTSNVGGAVPNGPGLGFSPETPVFETRGVHRALEQSFRREFLNRIDRVIAFQPLSRATMRAVLEKELDDVFTRRGLRNRDWAVEFEDSAIEFLLDHGFTPDLGARPLKRAIERYLLAPLAMTIVNHQLPEGDQFLFVRADAEALEVEFVDPDAPAESSTVAALQGVATDGGAGGAAGTGARLALESVALHPTGTHEELDCLRGRYAELAASVEAEGWRDRKSQALARLNEPDFWSSPERFRTLGLAEYLDRIETGVERAGSLLERLSRTGGRSSVLPKDLVGRLAMQLFLLHGARCDVDEDSPSEAFLLVRPRRERGTDLVGNALFAERLLEMYRAWARKRNMRVTVLDEKRGEDGRFAGAVLSVTGYASYRLLRGETGFHVLETESENGKSARAAVRRAARVQVAPHPDTGAPSDRRGLEAQARAALAAMRDGDLGIVRHYREAPSPLVRDHVHGWRTGRLDLVLGGDFDLISAVEQ